MRRPSRKPRKRYFNRLEIVPLKRVFKKGEYIGVAAKARVINPAWEPSDLILTREKAGLLQWALIGLQRALKRGNFVNTSEGIAALDAMRLESDPVSGFVCDCIRFDPERMMSRRISAPPSPAGGKKRMAARKHLSADISSAKTWGRWRTRASVRTRTPSERRTAGAYYVGIALNAEGAAHFDAVRTSRHRRSEWVTQNASVTAQDAVRVIPEKWQDHPVVQKIKKRGCRCRKTGTKTGCRCQAAGSAPSR